jgi:hypothetical protein
VCVLRSGRLESLPVYINVVTGDSTYRGQRFSVAFPGDSAYAGAARWYLDGEPVFVADGRYMKYGAPRILGPMDVVPVATFRGVTVFAEAGTDLRRPEVIYVPVRPGCEFQPYMRGGRK